MMVMFADIPGYDGVYRIASDGKVYSPNGIRKTYVSNSGYERVSLWKKGKGKKYSIHRLVASAFIPNPDGLSMVNHLDGNKLNNNVDNLEWCDASRNMRHAYENNLVNPKTRKVIQYTKDFEKVREWDSIAEACAYYGLNHANVITICGQKTRRKYAGGFIWRYADGNL